MTLGGGTLVRAHRSPRSHDAELTFTEGALEQDQRPLDVEIRRTHDDLSRVQLLDDLRAHRRVLDRVRAEDGLEDVLRRDPSCRQGPDDVDAVGYLCRVEVRSEPAGGEHDRPGGPPVLGDRCLAT